MKHVLLLGLGLNLIDGISFLAYVPSQLQTKALTILSLQSSPSSAVLKNPVVFVTSSLMV